MLAKLASVSVGIEFTNTSLTPTSPPSNPPDVFVPFPVLSIFSAPPVQHTPAVESNPLVHFFSPTTTPSVPFVDSPPPMRQSPPDETPTPSATVSSGDDNNNNNNTPTHHHDEHHGQNDELVNESTSNSTPHTDAPADHDDDEHQQHINENNSTSAAEADADADTDSDSTITASTASSTPNGSLPNSMEITPPDNATEEELNSDKPQSASPTPQSPNRFEQRAESSPSNSFFREVSGVSVKELRVMWEKPRFSHNYPPKNAVSSPTK